MNIQDLKPALIHLIKILLAETVYCTVAFYGYALFSFMFFGEGDKSFAYTKENGYIYWCVIVIPPMLFNLIYLFVNYYKGEMGKVYTDLLALVVLIIFSFTAYKICTSV
jgi:hypothetical protein